MLGLLALSLVPLSGYAGQISLCQYTSPASAPCRCTGSTGATRSSGCWPPCLCGVAGGVVALPAFRLRGIYLALATLAFAVVMDDVFFTSSSVFGSRGAVQVGRPDIFGLRFVTDRSFDVLIAIVLALCLIAVGALRRGPLRAPLGGHERFPGRLSPRGPEPDRHQVGRLRPVGRAGRTGRRPLRGAAVPRSGASAIQFPLSILIFAGVTLAGMSVLTGGRLTGVFVAVLPVIARPYPGCPQPPPAPDRHRHRGRRSEPQRMGPVYADAPRSWRRP